MAIVNATHTATTTRSAITRPARERPAGRDSGIDVEITNAGSVTVYIGGDDVEGDGSTGGTAIPAGEQWFITDVRSGDTLYVESASSTATLNILWKGV